MRPFSFIAHTWVYLLWLVTGGASLYVSLIVGDYWMTVVAGTYLSLLFLVLIGGRHYFKAYLYFPEITKAINIEYTIKHQRMRRQRSFDLKSVFKPLLPVIPGCGKYVEIPPGRNTADIWEEKVKPLVASMGQDILKVQDIRDPMNALCGWYIPKVGETIPNEEEIYDLSLSVKFE